MTKKLQGSKSIISKQNIFLHFNGIFYSILSPDKTRKVGSPKVEYAI